MTHVSHQRRLMLCVNCDAPATHRQYALSVTPVDAEPFCCACVRCPDEDCRTLEAQEVGR